ncbi:MAG: hypothetical protein SGJ21_17130, partial [Alphaproteobacteria bacterium]|nr:hypothetical protein [Alphaproteobacteria bacterium]
MKLLLACAAALGVCGSALAQTPSAFEPYVEANRPKMAVKALTAPEQSAMNKAVSAWKGRKSEAHLLAVRPFAEAGDPTAMKVMVQGYVHLQKSKSDRGASAQLATPTQGLIPLAGI